VIAPAVPCAAAGDTYTPAVVTPITKAIAHEGRQGRISTVRRDSLHPWMS
jgi:hypothetical protein